MDSLSKEEKKPCVQLWLVRALCVLRAGPRGGCISDSHASFRRTQHQRVNRYHTCAVCAELSAKEKYAGPNGVFVFVSGVARWVSVLYESRVYKIPPFAKHEHMLNCCPFPPETTPIHTGHKPVAPVV